MDDSGWQNRPGPPVTGGFPAIELASQLSLPSDQVSSLEPNPVVRRAITIDGYTIIDANIALSEAPLAACVASLAGAQGAVVLVSSSFVEEQPAG